MKSKALILAGTAMLSSISVSQQVAAQEGASQDRTTDEIIVTAQRREQSLQDTPIAVTAFNNSMMEERSITSVITLAANTPGLFLSQGTASPSTINVAMRGALEQNGGTITSESPVAIYIDDVYQSRLSAADYDLADIERVEVLRGPQGTLYGRNSMTGAIKLVTRQPDGRRWAKADLSYGRFDEVKTKVSLGAPLTDNIAVAASAFYNNRDEGWQYNITTQEDVSKFQRYGGQLALGLYDVDGIEAVLTGRYVNNKSDGQHFLPVKMTAPFDPAIGFYETRTPLPALGNNEQYSLSFRAGVDVSDSLTIRSITAYSGMKEHWALDFSGGYVLDGTNDAPVAGFYRDSKGKQNQLTQELQFLYGSDDERLNIIGGLFFFREKAEQGTAGDLFMGYPNLPSSIDTLSKSVAAYVQGDYEIAPKLTLSAGLRYTHDDKEFSGITPDYSGNIYDLDYGIRANVWTPKFNLQYEWSDDAMVYATVSKGYRAAGFNSLNAGDPDNYGKPYAPEFAWSYEVGTKLSLLDRALQFNLAAYRQSLTDLQTLATGSTPGSYLIQNAAKAKVQGIELETTLRPTTGLNLFGNVTYTYDKYKELDPASHAAVAGADRLMLISRWQYQVGGAYNLPIGSDSISFSADYNYRSSYNSEITLARSSLNPAIGRMNAAITYSLPDDRVQFYAQAANILNSKDWAISAEFVPGLFGYKIPLEPRVWKLGMRFKF